MYNREYFEEGVAKGISGYTNYTWLPEVTIPLAHRLIKRLHIKKHHRVLDFGCAKGFLVKALRLLDIDAFGCDVSAYAISQAPTEVREYVWCGDMKGRFDWIIAKDVLEHLQKDELAFFLKKAKWHASALFVVVPLGDGNGRYVIPAYENDVTHVIREKLSWWIDRLKEAGWKIGPYGTDMKGLKDSWAHYKDGNAFIEAYRP